MIGEGQNSCNTFHHCYSAVGTCTICHSLQFEKDSWYGAGSPLKNLSRKDALAVVLVLIVQSRECRVERVHDESIDEFITL